MRATHSIFNFSLDEEILIQFSFANVLVETVDSSSELLKKEIRISIQEKVEIFDSAHESARYSRPKLLVALGVLSFITGRNFSVYEVTSSSSSVSSIKENKIKDVKCIIEGDDYSSQLEAICNSINDETGSKNTLFFSLLDRWRKAQYQLIESEGEGLFEDESLLSFFHILELLVSEYQDEQKSEAIEKIDMFINELMSTTFKYRGPSLNEKINEKNKVIKDILLSGDLRSIGSKINYMFEKQGLLDERVQSLLQEFIAARNAIAHGRQVFRESLIWPLPPFFMLHANHFNLGYFICVLTARSIACHYKLDLWKSEWENILQKLPPPLDVIKSFIKNKHYQGLSTERFYSGAIDHVTPASIVDAYIKGKIKFPDFESCFIEHINNINLTCENTTGTDEPLYILMILADSESKEISKYSKKNIQSIYDNKSFFMPNIKDYLRFVEHYNIKLNWFREWIVKGMRYEPK
ncbi:hypothetical protein [Morganella morganii]|uniref:hypothetical protein n=1 Tax=Morganella morganii TaxID=582 RepID=UPI0021D26C66|nr:hypothetical protein [Morganella morganii]MCU6353752.1 hypothetical protein [Morganella morganii]